MKIAKIDAAIAEAQRFIDRAKELKDAKINSYNSSSWWADKTLDGQNCPREQGALRRASMDLTRTLAGLRKPD